MIELLAGLSAILAVLLIVAAVFAITYRDERDEARDDLETALGAQEILENRVTVRQWRNRGNIPPRYWPKIIEAAAEKGAVIEWHQFVAPEQGATV